MTARAAGQLYNTYPLRRETYAMLFGLIAATGMRVSEALSLRFADVHPDGSLLVHEAKLGKSRLVPLHPSTVEALNHYLGKRRKLPATDDHLFLSAGGRRISRSMVNYMFRRIAKLAGVASTPEKSRPDLDDLRHTFATRSLEACSTRREGVARHFVALSTYIGHSDIKHTYWYLEATPDPTVDIATAAEALVAGGTSCTDHGPHHCLSPGIHASRTGSQPSHLRVERLRVPTVVRVRQRTAEKAAIPAVPREHRCYHAA